jgi:hypothetical protein
MCGWGNKEGGVLGQTIELLHAIVAASLKTSAENKILLLLLLLFSRLFCHTLNLVCLGNINFGYMSPTVKFDF